MSTPSPTSPANAQKSRKGLNRVWHAAGYSIEGLKAGWHETAFRQEALAALVLVPLAFWLGKSWVEVALLAGSVVIVMIVELLKRMTKPYTRQKMLDAAYQTGLLKVDDVNVGPFSRGCVGKRLEENNGKSGACFCNQGNKILFTSQLTEKGTIERYKVDTAIYSELPTVGKTEADLGNCFFDKNAVTYPTIFLLPLDPIFATRLADTGIFHDPFGNFA